MLSQEVRRYSLEPTSTSHGSFARLLKYSGLEVIEEKLPVNIRWSNDKQLGAAKTFSTHEIFRNRDVAVLKTKE